MAQLTYLSDKKQTYHVSSRESESVLEAFNRQGISIPFSCRSGVCQICLQQCTAGEIPAPAQKGLSDELVAQGYFMPCKCIPVGDMQIKAPTERFQTAVVQDKTMLTANICRVLLEPPANFPYKAGQFINLRKTDGTIRSYSLASFPEENYYLEIHVQRKNNGSMSNWIIDELKPGDCIDIQAATGSCHYQLNSQNQPMLLIATGTGLAPLYGIIQEALYRQHRNEIHLYHGGRHTDCFYLRTRLRLLEQMHANFHYHECVSNLSSTPFFCERGRAHEVAFAMHQNLHDWQVYIAGLSEMVEQSINLATQLGALPDNIHSDAFGYQQQSKSTATKMNTDTGSKYPPQDIELWAALDHGALLIKILTDFYTCVYADEKLSSFFTGVTKQRLIEKQYLFIRQILTGEKVYFGDRPRNAHHWMVISEALFDYRESIMVECLKRNGLASHMIDRFIRMEDFFRADIVKSAPYPRLIGNLEMPLEGFEEMIIDVGSLCDSCAREVAPSEKVKYHVRLGKIYCADCNTPQQHASHEINHRGL